MKKIYILIFTTLLIFLSGCSTNINSSIYISSIGFEIEEDKLVSYFLSNPLTNISREDGSSTNQEAEYIKVKTTSVYDAFLQANQSLLSPLNFKHIKTVIFNEECFHTKYIDDFFVFMRSIMYVSFNYYVFATTNNIEEIYKFQNPEQISYQYSILSSPDLLKYNERGTEKIHFLDFANDYFSTGRYLHIPLIVINRSWNEKTTVEIDGFLCVDNPVALYKNSEYNGMLYLYDNDSIMYDHGNSIYRILNYRVNKYEKNNRYMFSISYQDIAVFGGGSKDEFEEAIIADIKKFLDSYIINQEGLYLIKMYNYLNKKALDVLNYDIEIKYKG